MKIVRCLTLNIWGEQPPLERRMALIAEGLRTLRPDVVAMQEVREITGQLRNQAEELADRAGYNHIYAPSMTWGGGQEGLALLMRDKPIEHVITELPHATADERRLLLSAKVDQSHGQLWIHTTHLNFRLYHGKQREDQIMAIEEFMASRGSEAVQVLMGDLNAVPESDEIRWLKGLTTLGGRRVFYQDAWDITHPGVPGLTWTQENSFTQRLRWLLPNRRLDYIFSTPMRRDGRGIIHGCRLVFDRPDGDGIHASDHYGLMAEVQVEPISPMV